MTVQIVQQEQQPDAGPAKRSPLRGYWLLIAMLLLVPVGLGAACAQRWTPTHDEYWHLPLGLHALQTEDCRADPINPPLIRMWAALPLWVQGVSLGELDRPAKDAYAVGDAFQRAHPDNHRELFFGGRLMMLPLGILGGWIVFIWAWRWWGDAAGLLAASLWCGCPLLLAHSAIVAHDMPVAVATLVVLFATMRFRERPIACGPWVIGGLIGVACLMKFSAMSLLVLVPAFWLIVPSTQTVHWRWQALGLLQGAIAWLIVLHLGYAMDTFAGQPLPPTSWMMAWLPRGFVQGLDALAATLKVSHPVFLNGEWSLTGFRTYYLYGLLYQLPLGLWACGLLATVLWAKRTRDRTELRRGLALGSVVAALLIPASLSANQLGLRYVMPIIPLAILFASSAARDWHHAGTARKYFVIIAAGLSLAALRYHPHHLSYFNELAGGPEHGREHLVDSNLDWGQDLHALRDYLRDHPSPEPLQLAYFGSASLKLLGIEYEFPASPQLQPGRYAISANYIAGRPHMLRDIDGRERMVALDEFAPFRFFIPKAMMGYSIAYYEISPEDVARYYRARQQAMEQFGGR